MPDYRQQFKKAMRGRRSQIRPVGVKGRRLYGNPENAKVVTTPKPGKIFRRPKSPVRRPTARGKRIVKGY